MKKICVCIVLMFLTAFSSCIARGGSGSVATGKSLQHTKEAKQVLRSLKRAAKRKMPFLGHQDDLMYGQDWWLNDNDLKYDKSDVYDVCGQYPYILGLDIGRIEEGGERNIDRCLFRKMKDAAIMHNSRGGLINIGWHMDNPISDSTAWDRTAGNVVSRILNDSIFQKKFYKWLDRGADFLNLLTDNRGRKIPVLFRPLAECNIEVFWWSPSICSDEEYVKLWRMVFDYYVNVKQMKQIIWVFSPYDVQNESEILARYPGDEYVDIIGYERYQLGAKTYQEGAARFVEGVRKGLDATIRFSKTHKKFAVITETGFTGIPYDKWWTEALGKAISGKEIAYIHLWRNGVSESYYFGPCPASNSSDNFKVFIKESKVRLLER